MRQYLVLTVQLHDGRYHGVSEWPPAPARLFQALVAASSQGDSVSSGFVSALEWLEQQAAPIIAAPKARLGSRVEAFVPNNDIDAEDGDPERVSNIRTKKLIQPRLLEGKPAFRFAWPLDEEPKYLDDVLALTERLYQFGRGVDMAWATGEVLSLDALQRRLIEIGGDVFFPNPDGNGAGLACPATGSLNSLRERHAAFLRRFLFEGQGKQAQVVFAQPPKARFRRVGYASSCHSVLYELRDSSKDSTLWPWPLARAATLVERIRNAVASHLGAALPEQAAAIERFLVGRKPDASDTAPAEARVRIVPIPSIGHQHADHAIRRILVEVPAECPIASTDVHWAFSGRETVNAESGEFGPFILAEATDDKMVGYYAPASGAHRWRSITPVVLPEQAGRRRIDPARRTAEAKDAGERGAEEARAIGAVVTALRHAEVHARPVSIRVQREPFHSRGTHAEAFAEGTRFSRHRLWHVEVAFDRMLKGPLVIGDGRFLGLGVMAPLLLHTGIISFEIVGGLSGSHDPEEIARALRRASMARIQSVIGPRVELSPYFSGHQADGSPARNEEHLSFFCDSSDRRLYVLPPHIVARRETFRWENHHLEVLEKALSGMSELRAGSSGLLALTYAPEAEHHGQLFMASRFWESVTPYQVTRHAKAGDANLAIALDVERECRRRNLPKPKSIAAGRISGVSGVGLSGMVQLEFAVAVSGPILLGRSRHMGGGAFRAVPDLQVQ